jgi:hypothetical protein
MLRLAALISLAIALLLAFAACDNGSEGSNDGEPGTGVTVEVSQDGSPVPGATVSGDADGDGDVTAVEACQENPDPVTGDFQVIDAPEAGATVTSPVTVSGQILAFEAAFQVAIFDPDGNAIVAPIAAQAQQADIGQLAPFSVDVPFVVTEQQPGCIWVYEESARDGSIIHVGQIPVTLNP